MSNQNNTQNTFLNGARVAELWAAVQEALGKKAGRNEIVTPAELAAEIEKAMTGYATDAAVKAQITAALASYLTAAETESKIAAAVAQAANIRFEAVDTLPETGEEKVVYLVPGDTDSSIRNQYMWIDGSFELLGSTEIDLSNYWAKSDLRVMTSEELQAILTA